jgi:hypothetical protein
VVSEGEGINRIGHGGQSPSPPQKQEFTMKKFVLAAIAALSLGIGSAYAMQPLTSHLGQTINGPAYSDDSGSVQ